MTEDLLNRGIAALKAGRKAEARGLLAQLVEQEPRHELGWLWLSGAVDTDEDRRVCLENVLAINPNNEIAKRGLPSLVVQESAPTRESLTNGFEGDDVFQPTDEQLDTSHLTSTIQGNIICLRSSCGFARKTNWMVGEIGRIGCQFER